MVNTYLAPSPVIPKFIVISNITNSYPMVITVTESNNYVVGQCVILTIPSSYGMIQANGLTGVIVAVDGLNLSVNIDSSQFDTFSVPPLFQPRPASVAPAGSRNSYNTTWIPFRSEGNTGN